MILNLAKAPVFLDLNRRILIICSDVQTLTFEMFESQFDQDCLKMYVRRYFMRGGLFLF